MDYQPFSATGKQLLDDPEDRHDEAIVVLVDALAAHEPDAVGLLVRAYRERGFRTEIIELLAPRVKPGHTEHAVDLGDALAATGYTDRAEDAYRAAVTGGDVAAMTTLGDFLLHHGQTREAEKVLRQAAEAGDELAPVSLAMLQWEHLPDPRTAVRTAERWADESRPSTLLGLAFVRAASGEYDEAERLYRRAAELGGYRAHIEYALFLRDARDDPEAAEQQMREAQRQDEPGWALAYGRFLMDAGRGNDAWTYLQHAVHWGDLDAAALLEELATGDAYDD